MAGEAETGITIMYMVEALDAGDIIAQKGLPILPEDDAGTLFLKLSELGAKLLLDTLPQLRAGRVEAIPQDEEKVSYAPILKREDEQIDWQKDAAVIVNHIRALSPMPGAFTTAFGQVCKIWRGKYVNTLFNGQPGTIQQISKEGITVVAGDGQGVQLLTLQPAGKKRMDVEDFLRGAGASWTVGQQLGGLL
jgi:methionyl-tRNA formyltransferase